jgi:hypothetical protein
MTPCRACHTGRLKLLADKTSLKAFIANRFNQRSVHSKRIFRAIKISLKYHLATFTHYCGDYISHASGQGLIGIIGAAFGAL